jgi:hypothetical protein
LGTYRSDHGRTVLNSPEWATNLTHHEALEHIAKSKGFENWHQVASEAKLNRTTETSYRSGLLVAYDVKAIGEPFIFAKRTFWPGIDVVTMKQKAKRKMRFRPTQTSIWKNLESG